MKTRATRHGHATEAQTCARPCRALAGDLASRLVPTASGEVVRGSIPRVGAKSFRNRIVRRRARSFATWLQGPRSHRVPLKPHGPSAQRIGPHAPASGARLARTAPGVFAPGRDGEHSGQGFPARLHRFLRIRPNEPYTHQRRKALGKTMALSLGYGSNVFVVRRSPSTQIRTTFWLFAPARPGPTSRVLKRHSIRDRATMASPLGCERIFRLVEPRSEPTQIFASGRRGPTSQLVAN